MNNKRERETVAPGDVDTVLVNVIVPPVAVVVTQFTPDAWGKKLGHFKAGDPRLPQNVPHFDAQHAAADALYGWSQHAYHYQAAPFTITEADYVAALEAAGRYPLCAPHAAALPASQVARFANFQPRRERVKASR